MNDFASLSTKKKIIYFMALTVCMALLLLAFHRTFSFKYEDGIYDMTAFYELEEDSVDVLILGSSHAFVNINPAVIWDESGITTYNLCGSIAPMWNSYFYLKEALKTQTPQMVILECYSLLVDWEYMDDSRIIKNTYGMNPSRDKAEAIMVSARPDRQLRFGLEYVQYHGRYTDLQKADYNAYLDDRPQYENYLGYYFAGTETAFEDPGDVNDGSRTPLPAKQEEYYRKILQLCNDQNIPMTVILAPYPDYGEYAAQIFNTASDIAAEYGCAFLNCQEMADEIEIDWEHDFIFDNHLNYRGAEKLSLYLADYLQNECRLPAHDPEDRTCDRWQKASAYYAARACDERLAEMSDASAYLRALEEMEEGYILIVQSDIPADVLLQSVSDAQANVSIETVARLFASLGITQEYQDACAGRVCVVRDGSEMTFCQPTAYGYCYSTRLGNKELVACDTGIYYDKVKYSHGYDGVHIVIVDKLTQRVADAVFIGSDGALERAVQETY